MGNSSSSNKASSPSPVENNEQKEVPVQKKCCGGCKKHDQEPVVIDKPAAAPVTKIEEPVLIEKPSEAKVDTPIVVVTPAEEPSVTEVTEALEKVKIEETPKAVEETAKEVPVEAEAIEAAAEPTEFSIAGKALKLDTAEDVAEIVEQIKSLKNLQKLSFVGNTMGVEASKAIADAIATHDTIKVVDFSDCFTGRMKEEVPVSVAALGSVLVKQKELESVNFSDNAFGPVGAKAMVELLSGSASLQDLILNNNGLGPEGGRIIAEALIDSAKARSECEHGRALRKVLIGRNRLENGSSAAFAKMLETHAEIEEFALPQCGIRSEGIIVLSGGLAKCNNLKSVDLQDNTFTTTGAKAFAEAIPVWKSLCTLNIGDCMCEEKGSVMIMKALVDAELSASLESFNFQYNEMREDGASILAENLSKFTSLKRLMLNGNAFDPEGASATQIKDLVDAEILDDWSDMEYEEEDLDEDDADSGFITEKERQELIVEAESDEE